MRGRPGNRGDPAGQGARVGVSAAPRPSGPPGVAGSRQTRGGIIRACHTTTQGTGNAAPPTPGPSRPPDVDGTTTRTRDRPCTEPLHGLSPVPVRQQPDAEAVTTPGTPHAARPTPGAVRPRRTWTRRRLQSGIRTGPGRATPRAPRSVRRPRATPSPSTGTVRPAAWIVSTNNTPTAPDTTTGCATTGADPAVPSTARTSPGVMYRSRAIPDSRSPPRDVRRSAPQPPALSPVVGDPQSDLRISSFVHPGPGDPADATQSREHRRHSGRPDSATLRRSPLTGSQRSRCGSNRTND